MIATVRSRPSRTTVTRAGAAARQPSVCAPAQRWVEIWRLSASVPPRTPSTATTWSPCCRTLAAPRDGSSVSTRLVTPSATPQPSSRTISSTKASTMLTAGPAAMTTIRFHTGWRK